jgi:hypothetical protein
MFCSNVSGMSLFYSRRIGRQPQGAVTGDAVYASVPGNTEILGAAKVTGRTHGGFQLGVMDAVTRREHAEAISPAGERFTEEVEPLSNYFVARTKRVMRGGNLTLGAMATSVARSFEGDALPALLPGHAEALGADWSLSWKNRTYNLMGSAALSSVGGDTLAIQRLQRSSARYFQRPEHGGLENGFFTNQYDASLTTMRGWGGYARLAKQAGDLQWETSTNVRSPGFEVNSLGFLSRADYVWMNANVRRSWTKPTSWYRRAGITAGGQQQYDFEGDLTDRQVHTAMDATFPNYWNAQAFVIHHPEWNDVGLTRGGPIVRHGGWNFVAADLGTDERKSIVLSADANYSFVQEGPTGYSVSVNARMKPRSNVTLQVGPSVSRDGTAAQFVGRFADPTATAFYGHRIVVSDLVQHTVSMDTRLAVTFTPTLTLELFAQPFASSGDYGRYKEFVRPRAIEKRPFDPTQLTVIPASTGRDSLYVLDPDRDPSTANFTFSNPDFNFRSLRGNAVVRWEYRPGSTLYFVWQQQRSAEEPFGDFDLLRDSRAPFREHPDNVFVIKASYWFGT